MKQVIRILLTILTGVMFCSIAIDARGQIKGRVMESRESGAPFATVQLLSSKDSSMVKGAITDEDGEFNIQSVNPGEYLLGVSSIGYSSYIGEPFVYGGDLKVLSPIVLSELAVALDEVVVKGQRPVMERKSDRFVMDVTSSSFQADNLMDIFRALPFVQISDGGIAINGRPNVLIVLDNVQMPGATMNTILENMTGDEIENIEFITNPSSRYPSNINSVIRITTKKSKNYGLTGSARGNFSQGVRFRGSGGVSLIYRKEKWFADLNVNYSSNNFFLDRNGYRTMTIDGVPRVFNEAYESITVWNTLMLRGRVEYSFSPKHAFGIQANYSNKDVPDRSLSNNQIGFSNNIGGVADSTLVSDAITYGYQNTQNYSAYYSGKLDDKGRRMDLVLTYTPIGNRNSDEMFFQDMLSSEGDLLANLPVVRNTAVSNAKIYVGQLDFELPFENGWNGTAGAKVTLSTNKTRPFQEVKQNGLFVKEEEFSFQNDFEEQIWAGYGSLGKTFGKTSIDAGLRVEHSTMLVQDLVESSIPVDRVFTDFFPTLMISRKLSEQVIMSFNYRETISRPGFSVLTPYRIYRDDFTILEGNPELRPQYNRSLTINSVIKENLFLEAEYKQERDVYTHIPELVDNTMILKMRNFDLDYYSLTMNYSYQFTDWWSGSVFGMGALYNGRMFQENFRDIEIPQSFFHTFGINNTLSLPKNLKLDLGYNYTGPFHYGLVKTITNQFTRIALSGGLFENKLRYTISALDVFRGSFEGGEITSFNTFMRSVDYRDARRIQIGLVYTFGKKTVKRASSKGLGNEDVIDRVD